MEEMKREGVPPDRDCYICLLCVLRTEQSTEALEICWNEMIQSGILPDTRCHNEMLCSYAVMGDISKCQEIFQALCRTAYLPDQCTFLALFTSISTFLHKSHALHHPLTHSTRVYAERRSRQMGGMSYEEIRALVEDWEEEMKQRFKIRLSGALLTVLLQLYGRLWSVVDVERVMQWAEREGLKPDLHAYNTAISAVAAGQKVHRCHPS